MIVKKFFSLLFLLLAINCNICQGKNTIKILFIGSSHGRNTIGQFPILAYHSGVDVVCANAYAGGLPIEEVADLCISGGTFRELYKKFYDGAWHENIPNMTILNMLQDEEWDIISIQRSAAEDRYCGSGDGSLIHPEIRKETTKQNHKRVMRSGSWIQATGSNNGHQLRDYSKSSNRSEIATPHSRRENRPLI